MSAGGRLRLFHPRAREPVEVAVFAAGEKVRACRRRRCLPGTATCCGLAAGYGRSKPVLRATGRSPPDAPVPDERIRARRSCCRCSGSCRPSGRRYEEYPGRRRRPNPRAQRRSARSCPAPCRCKTGSAGRSRRGRDVREGATLDCRRRDDSADTRPDSRRRLRRSGPAGRRRPNPTTCGRQRHCVTRSFFPGV